MKINKSIITLFLVMAMSVQLFGQQQNTAEAFPLYPYKPNKEYYKSYWTAIKKRLPDLPIGGKKSGLPLAVLLSAGRYFIFMMGKSEIFFRHIVQLLPTMFQNTVLNPGEAGIILFLFLVAFTSMVFLPIIQKRGRWPWPERRLLLWVALVWRF